VIRLSLAYSFADWRRSRCRLCLDAFLFLHGRRRAVRAGLFHSRSTPAMAENLAQFLGYIVVDRAGVSLLFRNA
jgi:hypothetical protein